MLQVSDTLVDSYENKALAEAAHARTQVGEIKPRTGKDGEVVGYNHVIPFKKWTVAEATLAEDVLGLAKILTPTKLVKIINSGLDLAARQARRAELKESEPGKKAARTAAQMWIYDKVEAGDMSYLRDYKVAMQAGQAEANAYLDDLIASDEYKASQAA